MKDKEIVDLKHIIIYYLKHWKVFLVSFVISLILAVLYLLLYPKTYEIFSTVQLQDEKNLVNTGGGFGLGEAAGMMKSFGLGGITGGGVNLDDELVIFQSHDLLSELVKELGLYIEYSEPYKWGYKLYHSSPFVADVDSLMQENLPEEIELKVSASNNKGTVKIKIDNQKDKYNFDSLPFIIPTKYGNIHLSSVGANTGKVDILIRPISWVAEDMLDNIYIDDYSKTSNVVELAWYDHEKQRGLDILSTLIRFYNDRADFIKRSEGKNALLFLDGRIREVTKELSDIEVVIEEYKIKNNLTDIELDIQFYIEQAKELRSKIIELESQLHAVNMMDTYVKDSVNKYNLVPMLLSIQEGEKGSAIGTYNEALVERARILKNSSIDNPLMNIIDTQVDQLRKSVYLTIENARQSLLLTLNDLKQKEELLFLKMGEVPTQERLYIDYKRQQEIFQGVYLILLQKREEIALSTQLGKEKAQIVNAPYVKKKPVAPRKLYAAVFLLIFTIALPALYLYLKGQLQLLFSLYRQKE